MQRKFREKGVTVSLQLSNTLGHGQYMMTRDGSVVLTYDATALNLDFSEAQVTFQMYETWVTTPNGYSYIEGYTVDRSFSVDELNLVLDGLVEDGKVVASKEEINTAEAMYNALADYQLPLVENKENLAMAIKHRDRVLGDVNGDDKITVVDYSALILSLLGRNTDYDQYNLDVDQSGTVDSGDTLALLQHMLGISNLG